jgi:hypothetical protein
MVETTVVLSFLIVTSHVLRSLSRRTVFLLNSRVVHTGRYLVTDKAQFVAALSTFEKTVHVAENSQRPRLLIATVALTAFAAVVSVCGIFAQLRSARLRSKGDDADSHLSKE